MEPEINETDLTLFVACYNEEQGIIPSIETVVAAATQVGLRYDIVVVDDASRDRSVELVQNYMAQHPDIPLTLVVNQVNQGLGSNFVNAAFFGHGKYYRQICGDDTEPVETLVSVFRHVGEVDIVLTYHTDTRARTVSRRAVSRLYTFMVNLLSGHRIKYYNGLPMVKRAHVLRWHSNARGFGFNADLVTRLLDMRATYLEIPVVPQERASGVSKAFTFDNFCSVGHTLLEIVIRRVGNFMYPKLRDRLKNRQTVSATQAVELLGRGATPREMSTADGAVIAEREQARLGAP